MKIPFNRPYMTGQELSNIAAAHENGRLAGDGPFTGLCHAWLEKRSGAARAFLTHSCTAALELAALVLDIKPGDEVIMPSYTFVSTANAFALRGAVPVFVDIREDSFNLDETLIEAAITGRTRVILPVHYAGVSCEMDGILDLARERGLLVVEDAAQGAMASYKGRALGSMGALGAYSFHETKNLISGEGGCLLVNDPGLASTAEIMREKGTDRGRFFRGEADKYTWQQLGSSFLPGELMAAFLWAQCAEADSITSRRMQSWQRYHALLAPLEASGALRRPVIPAGCAHNAHMYQILLPASCDRQGVIDDLKAKGIHAVFHYVPLHSSPGGRRYGRCSGGMRVTDSVSERVLRLPLWIGLSPEDQERIVSALAVSIKIRDASSHKTA